MSSSKKLTCKGTLRQVFICLRPRTPPQPPYTLYTCMLILIHTGRGGGRVEPERRLEFTKLGRKYQHERLYLWWKTQLWWTPTAKSLYRSILLMTTFRFGVYIVNQSMISNLHVQYTVHTVHKWGTSIGIMALQFPPTPPPPAPPPLTQSLWAGLW